MGGEDNVTMVQRLTLIVWVSVVSYTVARVYRTMGCHGCAHGGWVDMAGGSLGNGVPNGGWYSGSNGGRESSTALMQWRSLERWHTLTSRTLLCECGVQPLHFSIGIYL